MTHLEFSEKLDQFGFSFRSTNYENKVKTIEISNEGGISQFVEIKNFQCKYVPYNAYSNITPLQAVIINAIDIDSWKHSLHNEIEPNNYEKFREIIQEKMIEITKKLDFLSTVYFLLNHELSKFSLIEMENKTLITDTNHV